MTLTLPAPLFLQTFDSTAEGSVPAGWTVSNQSDNQDIAADLGHLGSLAYANFTTVSTGRLAGDFLTYGGALETKPFAQILGPSSASYVANGALVRTFANGNVLLGVSGYHGGNNQALEALTPSYNLAGKKDIYLSFHSLLEQNQDSIEGIEVTTDGGATWKPVVYYLEPSDIVKNGSAVDLDLTYNSARGDIAFLPDGSGGTYGAFLKAPLNDAVGAATQPRIDNGAVDGTRVELFRIQSADDQANVQFRIFYAGTDSWYFGLDDFGIYSIPPQDPTLTTTFSNGNLTISWNAGLIASGFQLQASPTLAAGSWATVPVTGDSFIPPMSAPALFFRLFKP